MSMSALDCDLKSFFDTVNHERLMNLLARRIADKRVLQFFDMNGLGSAGSFSFLERPSR